MTTRGTFPVIGTDSINFSLMSADTDIAPIIDTADAVSSAALIHNNVGTYTVTTVGAVDSIIYVDNVSPGDQAGTVARKVADAISDSSAAIVSDVYVNMADSLTASAIAYSALTEGTSNTTYRKIVDDAVSGTRLLNEGNTEHVPNTEDSTWTLRLNTRRGVSKTNSSHFYANAAIAIGGTSVPGTLSETNRKYVVTGSDWSTDYDISVTLTANAADGETFYIAFYGNSNAPQAELPVIVRSPVQDVDGFYRTVEEGGGNGLIDRAHSFPDSMAARILYSDVRMNEDAGLDDDTSPAWNPVGYSYEARLLARVPTLGSTDAGTWHNITAYLSDSRNWSSEAGAAEYKSEDASLKLIKDGTRVGSDVLLSVTGLPERYQLTAADSLPLDGTAVEVEFDSGASAADLASAFVGAISFPGIEVSGTTTSGSTSVTLGSANSLLAAGMEVSGTGIDVGTTIASVSGTALVLSANATATGSSTLTFAPYDSAISDSGVVALTFHGLASYPSAATFEAAGGRVDVKTVMTVVDVDFSGVDATKLSGTHFEIGGQAYWFKQSTPSVLDYTRSDSQSWSVASGSNNLIKYRLMLRALDENEDGYGTWAVSEFYNSRSSSDDGPDDMERDGYRLLNCAYDAERDDSTDMGMDRFTAVGEALSVRYPDGSGSVDLGVRFLRRDAQSLAALVGAAEEGTAVDPADGARIRPAIDGTAARYVRASDNGTVTFPGTVGPFAWSSTSPGDAGSRAYGLLTITAADKDSFRDGVADISYVLAIPNGTSDVTFTFSGTGATNTATADYTIAYDTAGADEAEKLDNSIAALFAAISDAGFGISFTKSEWVSELESRRTAPMLMRDEAYLDEFSQTGSEIILAPFAGDAVDATLRRASSAAVPF